jgi:hypothetical protein
MTPSPFTPAERIVRQYRGIWANLDPATRHHVRVLVVGKCERDLLKAGLSHEQAAEMAQEVVKS